LTGIFLVWYIRCMDPTTFSALAEPHRLDIVELLRSGPRPVNEIVDKLRLNQPQVSKHLKVLAAAGIVEVKPQAQQRIYALQSRPFKELDTWLHSFRSLWDERFERLDALLAKEVHEDE
jgi:DNA-binding transcriptional ArsR family regulator